jgi:competence protein ComEC
MSRLWKLNIILLMMIAVAVWIVVANYPEPKLKIIACDVGQGDAILITYSDIQILVDGGPNDKVLDCLSKHLAFWDREIELVVLTHPQKDHYGGLIEVFRRYKVGHFLANALDSSSEDYQVLKNVVGGGGSEVINPTTGMVIRLSLIRLDILNPSDIYLADNLTPKISQVASKNVLGAYTSSIDPNLLSITFLLDYKNFEALFTGDIDKEISDDIAEMLVGDPDIEDGVIEYLKVPHHGSKNGLSQNLLNVMHPVVSVVSNSKNNSYGHPHKEILDMLESSGTRILRTDEAGDVVVVSDGESYSLIKD